MQGNVLTWGRSPHGQLGQGRRHRNVMDTPTALPTLAEQVCMSSCGHYHSAAVTASAQVYTWGRGALGLLGHGDEEDMLKPRLVRALVGTAIHRVACGEYHTAAVTELGHVYCWGWRMEHADGASEKNATPVESYATSPYLVHALSDETVRTIACGPYCTAAATISGALYTWGRGDHGQLGHGHKRGLVDPERVQCGVLMASDAFSWDACFGRYWLLLLTASGDVCSCGATEGGVLGRRSDVLPGADARSLGIESWSAKRSAVATLSLHSIPALQEMRVCAIACGDAHNAAATCEGEVYAWGRGAYGKLGHGGVSDAETPQVVHMIRGKRVVEVRRFALREGRTRCCALPNVFPLTAIRATAGCVWLVLHSRAHYRR